MLSICSELEPSCPGESLSLGLRSHSETLRVAVDVSLAWFGASRTLPFVRNRRSSSSFRHGHIVVALKKPTDTTGRKTTAGSAGTCIDICYIKKVGAICKSMI